jgi:hypothetical protein
LRTLRQSGKNLLNYFYNNLLIIFNILCLKNSLDTVEELRRNDSVFVFLNAEIKDCTPDVEWFDDLVLVVAGEDESAVATETPQYYARRRS